MALVRSPLYAQTRTGQNDSIPADSVKADSVVAPYEPTKTPTFEAPYRFGDPFSNRDSNSPLLLSDPSSIDMDVAYDSGFNYTIYERIGDVNFRPVTTMTFEEYDKFNDDQITKEYFQERSAGLDGESAVSGRSLIPRLYISPMLDRLFGGSYVDIQPTGFVTADLGGRFQRTENPELSLRQQKNFAFDFDLQMSLNLVGKVGEKMTVTANWDNNNSFDFQNNMKIEYTGFEEDIVKKIEIGNVSMPVSNSLMTGAQSLFGVKTQLQFGKLFITSVVSRQQGQNEVITVGGDGSSGQNKEFEVQASGYDENKHFFLGHFFRNNYEKWHSNMPVIVSGLNVTRVEVYVLNRNNETSTTRQIAAFQDLGESKVIYNESMITASSSAGQADNEANNMWSYLNKLNRDKDAVLTDILGQGFVESEDFVVKGTVRKLDDDEFTINKKLGYVSLLRALSNDEILAVSYEYTYNGQAYKVGEMMDDYSSLADNEVIFLKMLRPDQINVNMPTWDLMMKNIYYINARQIEQDGFEMRIRYRDDASGIDNPSLHEGEQTTDIPLVQLLKLDQLNTNGDFQPDGNFDFIDEVTIDTDNGLIKFPVLEPFGSTLGSYFTDSETSFKKKYVYSELYDRTQTNAELVSSKDKFFIKGKYSAGSSSVITLGAYNLASGSVIVSAGGTPLTEGLDFSVDYNLGTVTILNEGILSSGQQITISYEKSDLFSFQARWLYGTRLDYQFSENFNIGATIMHLNERPGGVYHYQIGSEPTSNTKYGFDINFQDEVPFLTKAVDFLPLVSTKAPSSISFNAEFAQLIPGTSNEVNGEGTSYIDDFESAASTISIEGERAWKLAATPQTSDEKFTRGYNGTTDSEYNDLRARIAWYNIDKSVFYYQTSSVQKPSNIDDEDLENHYVRPIGYQEIYRQRDRQQLVDYETSFDIAYFPSERGQYNYNDDLENGLLRNPEDNWGGITTAITGNVDFQSTNVEYIEFWMMDPFIGNERGVVIDGRENTNNTSGGKLIFNLGSISEDIIPDKRHGFESGLPADGDATETVENEVWGRTPSEAFLLNYFEQSTSARDNQDVGLDGLSDETEAAFFSSYVSATGGAVAEDPSADNYVHFLNDSYNQKDAKILERYKYVNGMDGNSPIPSGAYSESATSIPDNEDLNNDNTVFGGNESYFEYTMDLQPGELRIGENFIEDEIVSQDGEATWYLFRIPVNTNNKKTFGDNVTLQNIKFIRMYLTEFSQPVVLRMVDLQLVKSEWRKYTETMVDPGLDGIPENPSSEFSLSVVNIEENSAGSENKSPYVLPPGVQRDQDNSTYYNRNLNEQSIQICVEDLADRDARAVYKNVAGFDLLNYGRLKMFFHAEAYDENSSLEDNEVTGFLRLGTDQTENYYEIEIPLKVTPLGLSASDPNIEELVWPDSNNIDLDLDELLALKVRRNNEADVDLNTRYSIQSNDGAHTLTVKGNPDLSTIMTMMIGVRNPESDDQADKSVCIWANELRVTDFDTQKGWAAKARLSAKLADLATINASTQYTSVGFGTIQQTISQRTREETYQYDVSANVNLDKFLLPHKTGLKVPMYVSYQESKSTPKYDPLDPDTPLRATLLALETDEERDRYKSIVEERSERRSINFTNVRKEKVKEDAKKHFFDIENMSFSYAYSEQNSSNVNTQSLVQRTISGGVTYNYSPIDYTFEPFGGTELFDSPYLQMIKDINLSLFPSSLSFSSNLNRSYRMTQYYNDDLTIEGVDPNYIKTFTFVRNYGLRWGLTKNLNFDYTARVNALIDEPEPDLDNGIPGIIGAIDTDDEKSLIWDQIKGLGRMKQFDQDMSVTYRTPLDKLPFTDWISADVKYAVGYTWRSGSVSQTDSATSFFGHTLQNSRDRGLSSKADLTKLYDKVTFLKQANKRKRNEEVSLGTGILRFLMMVKNVNMTYNIRESSTLAGFNKRPFLMGMDSSWNAPGWRFIAGDQDPNIRYEAARNGWLVDNPLLTTPFEQTFNTEIGLKASLEPFKDFKVQLTASRRNIAAYQEIFRYIPDSSSLEVTKINGFAGVTPSRSGSYSINVFTLKTAFVKDRKGDHTSATFDRFQQNIEQILSRMNAANEFGQYDSLSQDVLIPAFISAYSGQDAGKIKTTPFPKIPIPGWRIDYSGLGKLKALSDLFSSVTISHGYNSVYNVNSYTNSLEYDTDLSLDNNIINYPEAYQLADTSDYLLPVYIINQVSIVERFSPLLGINVRTKNNISARVEYKKDRTISLNMSNVQITETKNNDFTVDLGYTKAGFKLPFKIKGRTVGLENDITFKLASTVRNGVTIQRKFDGDHTITAGNVSFQLSPRFTYKLSQKLDLTGYFERRINEPRISAYKTSSTAFGFQFRFNLAQ